MSNESCTISDCDSAFGSIRTVQCDESKEIKAPDFSMAEVPGKVEMTPLKEIPILSPSSNTQDKETKGKVEQYRKVHKKGERELSFSDFLAALQCADSIDSSRISTRARSGQTSIIEKLSYSLRNQEIHYRGSLPVHGSCPSSLYCRTCEKEVHTVIGYSEHSILAEELLKILAFLFSCCGMPLWLSRLMVHKCPDCKSIIGNTLGIP